MNSLANIQELAHRFNEDEAVWRCFASKRALRDRRNSRLPYSEHLLAYLDYLDWLAAEQKSRMVRAIGFLHPRRPGSQRNRSVL